MTTLLVQKDKLLFNYTALQNAVKVPVIPVLKANALGLGDVETARLLRGAGARMLAVSRIEEAERLKGAVKAEILLLTPYSTERDAEKIVAAGVTATIGSYDSAVLLNGIAEKHNVKCRVHIEFDTGMGRFGFLPEEAEKAVQAAKYLKNLEICGCSSTLTGRPGKNKKSALRQLGLFQKCVEILRRNGINPGLRHVADSAAGILYPKLRLDAVCCGSALLGRAPVRTGRLGLKKVGRLQSEVCDVRWLPARHNIGGPGSFQSRRPMRIAVIPIGYADGLYAAKPRDAFRLGDTLRYVREDFRRLFKKNRLFCEIGSQKAPVVGSIDPCSVIVDVSSINCDTGDIASFDTDPLLVNSYVRRSYI